MKTREEVEGHLKSTGYSKKAVNRILAFLVGAGVKEFDEQMIVKYGDGTWAEFYEWWNNEDECEDCRLCSLIEYLIEQHNACEDEKKKDEIGGHIEFLIDAFGDDEEIEVEVEITDEE